MPDPRLGALLDALDRAFEGPSWHGPSLLGAVRGMDETEAAWRPTPGAHNAWEYAVHAAYWTYRALRHVAAEPPEAFDEPGSDFFERPAEGRPLADDLDRLRAWHRQFREAVAALDPARLDAPAYDRYTIAEVVAGVAAHDAYHAGQIRLLRRLREATASGSDAETA